MVTEDRILCSIWLSLIAINLVTTGHYFDISLRDVGLCLSDFGLAKLTEAISIAGVQLAPMTGTTTPAAPADLPRAAA